MLKTFQTWWFNIITTHDLGGSPGLSQAVLLQGPSPVLQVSSAHWDWLSKVAALLAGGQNSTGAVLSVAYGQWESSLPSVTGFSAFLSLPPKMWKDAESDPMFLVELQSFWAPSGRVALGAGGTVAPFQCPFMFSLHFSWTQIPLPRHSVSSLL